MYVTRISRSDVTTLSLMTSTDLELAKMLRRCLILRSYTILYFANESHFAEVACSSQNGVLELKDNVREGMLWFCVRRVWLSVIEDALL